MHPFYLFSHFIDYFSSKLTYNRCKELVVSELYYKQNNPPNPQRLEGLFMTCCPRRIRTTTDRTKNCSATITPYDKQIGYKGSGFFLHYQIFSILLTIT